MAADLASHRGSKAIFGVITRHIFTTRLRRAHPAKLFPIAGMLASNPCLPVEILDNILEATVALDEGHTLLRCALTSHALCSVARRRFFNDLSISVEIDDGRLKKLKGLLISRNATIKATMFKTWRFNIGPNLSSHQDQRTFRRLRDVVSKGNVNRIRGFSLRYEVPTTALRRVPPPNILRLIQSMDGLETLELSAPFATLSSVVATSSRLMRLHTLDLNNRYLESEEHIPTILPDPFAALRSLTLSAPSLPLVEIMVKHGNSWRGSLTHVSLVICSVSEFDLPLEHFFEMCFESLKTFHVTLLDASSIAALSSCLKKLRGLEELELVCRFKEIHGFEDILGLVMRSFCSSLLCRVSLFCQPLQPHWSQKQFKTEMRRNLSSNAALQNAGVVSVKVVWFGPNM
ncbi:hypothetical protein BKA70DRAFT_1240999 [Coprinopsis sp. MPI-PUGE-AT-0042]|nr:hypothetical protein BKA70DRAFT_1240999 [Coprinopsis sp. MPI-PUGE-AT-0042]